ncbi:translocation/assembly module TamB [Candidatus Comchoanobacter bicostacola]|uniref:Translocation/assembly module TamB n=1 Tax=Candidatus Comchoanobacter bicostacola TaxID=2919598 RepID=A0ABY5DI83_9GAMM|nr:translocation/assembly module TamB [Candidatus Comchoanobacter bicostacola]UTC24343.1 translocation/assembly module TamB [Candidatus Comchoanobacter bicostacola]
MTKSIIPKIILLFVALIAITLSPLSNPAIAYLINQTTPINVEHLSGSLWSGTLYANKVIYPLGQIELYAEQVDISEISLLRLKANKVSIAEIKLSYLDRLPTYMRNLEYLNDGDQKLSLEINNQHYQASYHPITKKSGHIKLYGHGEHIELLTTQTHSTWQATFKDKQYGSIFYDRNNHNFFLKSHYKNADDQIHFEARGNLKKASLILNIENFTLANDSIQALIAGNINTDKDMIQLAIKSNWLDLSIQKTPANQTLYIGTLKNSTGWIPLMFGNIDFTMIQTEHNQFYTHLYSSQLDTSYASLKEFDLTYIPDDITPLNISIEHITSPFFETQQLSIYAQPKEKNSFDIKLIASHNDQTQLANLTILNHPQEIEVFINNITLRSNYYLWRADNNGKIKISETEAILTPLCITSESSSICSSGHYDKVSNDWSLKQKINNLDLNINTQGLNNFETEIEINQGVLNGDYTLYGNKTDFLDITGTAELKQIQSSLSNIIPNFLFPINIEINNGRLEWEKRPGFEDNISGYLESPQGNIHLKTHNNKLIIQAKNLTSYVDKNQNLSTDVDVEIGKNDITGTLNLKQFSFNPNTNILFQALENDITIIRHLQTEQSSNRTIDLLLQADQAPLNIYGFKGSADAQLTLNIPNDGQEYITGHVNLQSPSVILLNHEISLNQLDITYNQQSWLNGTINLEKTENATFHSGTTAPKQDEINLNVSGILSDPQVQFYTKRHSYNYLDMVTQILSKSDTLPPGNENFALLQIISGNSEDSTLLNLFSAINSISTSLNIDISFNQSNENNNLGNNSELVLSKKLTERIWLIIRHQLNDENNDIFALSMQIQPKVSIEGQYNNSKIGISILLSN